MKRFFLAISVCILLLSSVGCGTKPATVVNSNSPASSSEQTKDQVEKPQQTTDKTSTSNEKQELEIKAYFPDDQATKLVEKTTKVQWASSETKYQASFQALTQSTDKGILTLWKGKEAKLSFKDGTLSVDLTKTVQTGSTGEAFLVQTLLKTMFQFQEVERVQFLVNGKETETLGGHVSTDKPFTRKMMNTLGYN